MHPRIILLAATGLLVAGCVSIPEPDMADFGSNLSRKLAQGVAFVDPADEESREYLLHTLLGEPLTPSSVIQIALLSYAVHAELAWLGIGEASLVEAVQISNPSLTLGAMRPEGGGRWQLDFGLSQSLLEVLTRSRRQQLAEAEHRKLQLEVLERLTRHLQSVQRTYYDAVSAEHRRFILELMQEISGTEAELAYRLHRAGNISELDYLTTQNRAIESRLDAERERAEALQKRRTLATLLGVQDVESFSMPQQLPDVPEESLDIPTLTKQARDNRADLAILQESLASHQQQLALYQKTGRLDQLELALNAERSSNGTRSYGPEISVSLPVFHQGQARIAVFNSAMKQLEYRIRALNLRIDSDISQALVEMESSRQQLKILRETLIPQRERMVELGMERYNFMLSGVDKALQARQQEYAAYLRYAEMLSRYWQARSDLAIALGGNLNHPPVAAAPIPDIHHGQNTTDHSGHANHQGKAGQQLPSTDHIHHGDHP